MDLILEISKQVGKVMLQWLLSPFYWLSIVLIALHYRRQVMLERKLFAVKMYSWTEQTWYAGVGGFFSGIAVSLAAMGLGISLSSEVIILFWIITLLLLLFRIRFLCLAYSASLLAIIQYSLRIIVPEWGPDGWLGEAIASLRMMNVAGLLVLGALLHLVEAVLIRKQASRLSGPLFMESKRGRVMGAYRMQAMWPIPLFMLLPAATGGGWPWTLFIGGGSWQQDWTLIVFPVVIGFSELTLTKPPQQKAALSSSRLFAYAVLLLALSLLALRWEPFVLVAAIASLVIYEGLIWLSRKDETALSPFFMQVVGGLQILAVLPNSPADELGIVEGEVITKVNGIKVETKEQLHQALAMNAAFCKLEVNNLAGEVRFLQCAVYAGEHHHLGLLPVPDDSVEYVAITRQLSLFSYFRVPWSRSRISSQRSQDGNSQRLPSKEDCTLSGDEISSDL